MTRLDTLLSAAQWQELGGPPMISVEEYVISRCLSASDGDARHTSADAAILSVAAPACVSGTQLFQELSDHLRVLATGCSVVDRLLSNGLHEGQVVEVAGTTASGKTQVCHQVASSTAVFGNGVLYIDTTNSFNATRVMQLAEGIQTQGPRSSEAILGCISVLQVHSIHQLLAVLNELTSQLTRTQQQQQPIAAQGGADRAPGALQSPLFTTRPSVIIIDSVSAVISPVIGNIRHTQGYTLMSSVARALKSLACSFHLAVLVTNHVTAGRGAREDGAEGTGGGAVWQGPGEHMVPALGEAWRAQVHARIQLHMVADPEGLRLATLVTHNSKATGESGYFRITGSRLVEELRA